MGDIGEVRVGDARNCPAWLAPWLTAVLASIVAMIVLGGIVRLARAGLSIVEWQPIGGVLPPLSGAAWEAAFSAYRASPEYLLINEGMSLRDFQQIYWLEYLHRLLGRLAGLLLVVPLAVGLLRRRFPRPIVRALCGVAALFALQGLLGWLMVASGLNDVPWVSPYRLAAHLWLALGLLAAVEWLVLHEWAGPPPAPATRLRGPALTALALTVLQIGLGALVAGHRAGWVADTFPLMQGRWIPPGVTLSGLLADPVAVHWLHRWFAFPALAAVLWLHGRARSGPTPMVARRLVTAAALVTLAQVGLGIVVVLTAVPVWLASLHQAVAVVLFGLLVAVAHQARDPRRDGPSSAAA